MILTEMEGLDDISRVGPASNFPNKEPSGLQISTPGTNSAITSIHQYFLALVVTTTNRKPQSILTLPSLEPGEKRLQVCQLQSPEQGFHKVVFGIITPSVPKY